MRVNNIPSFLKFQFDFSNRVRGFIKQEKVETFFAITEKFSFQNITISVQLYLDFLWPVE